jgi:nitroreductase
MDVIEAIHARRSIRGYKTDPVPKKVLEEIVEACQWAGSPGNMQPWEFAILGGDTMEKFRNYLIKQTEAKAPPELEFSPPFNIPELYDKRRTVYYRENFDRYVYPPGTENVEEQKHAHFLKGARLFDAPNVIIIYTDKAFLDIPWAIISIGLIAQTLCLAAVAHGLGTCIMGRLVDWPNMLREMLGVSQSKVFICGMAIGYPDLDSRVNNVPRIRMPLEEWVHWHGF